MLPSHAQQALQPCPYRYARPVDIWLARQLIESRGESWFDDSVADIERALRSLYGAQDISIQQLSATFRRGDLIEKLLNIDV